MAETDNGAGVSTSTVQPGDLEIEWREVPTVLVDSIVGWVNVAGIPRLTLGQVSYKPGGSIPRYLPTVTIAMPAEGMRFMANQILDIADQIEASESGHDQSAG